MPVTVQLKHMLLLVRSCSECLRKLLIYPKPFFPHGGKQNGKKTKRLHVKTYGGILLGISFLNLWLGLTFCMRSTDSLHCIIQYIRCIMDGFLHLMYKCYDAMKLWALLPDGCLNGRKGLLASLVLFPAIIDRKTQNRRCYLLSGTGENL